MCAICTQFILTSKNCSLNCLEHKKLCHIYIKILSQKITFYLEHFISIKIRQYYLSVIFFSINYYSNPNIQKSAELLSKKDDEIKQSRLEKTKLEKDTALLTEQDVDWSGSDSSDDSTDDESRTPKSNISAYFIFEIS